MVYIVTNYGSSMRTLSVSLINLPPRYSSTTRSDNVRWEEATTLHPHRTIASRLHTSLLSIWDVVTRGIISQDKWFSVRIPVSLTHKTKTTILTREKFWSMHDKNIMHSVWISYLLYEYHAFCMNIKPSAWISCILCDVIPSVWISYLLYEYHAFCMNIMHSVWISYLLYGYHAFWINIMRSVWISYLLYDPLFIFRYFWFQA